MPQARLRRMLAPAALGLALAAGLAPAPTPAARAQMAPDFTQISRAVSGIITPWALNTCNFGLCDPPIPVQPDGQPSGLRLPETPPAVGQGGGALKTPAGPGPASNVAAPPPTAFRYAPAVSREVREGLVARTAASGGAGVGRALAAELARHDTGALYASLVARHGLRRGDVADAAAAYMLLGWHIANGVTDDPPPSAVRAVRDGLAASFAGNPLLADEASRQRVGEELELLFVVAHAGWRSAITREGPAAAALYADATAAAFRDRFGTDLRRLVLTEGGFRPK